MKRVFCLFISLIIWSCLYAESIPYTMKNGHFPRNIVEFSDKRLVIEGLPSRFLIKLKPGYHVEYASLFNKNKYVCFSFAERVAKGAFLDDTTEDGYLIANGPISDYETKVVILKPIFDKNGKLQYDDAHNIIGEAISPLDNPVIDVRTVPEFQSNLEKKEILSKTTARLPNLNRTDDPVHIKTNDGHVFCIATYSLIDDDGVKRFKGYLLSISENNCLDNQIVKRLDYETMHLRPCNTPQLVFDESVQRLFIMLDNQIITSDDYGKTFEDGKYISISDVDFELEDDCTSMIIPSGSNGIVLENGTICFPVNLLYLYKNEGINDDGEYYEAKEVKYSQSFIVYSNDKGKTWKQSPLTPKSIISWEFSIVEYKPNKIMINARGGTDENWKRTSFGRRVFISNTRGKDNKWRIKKWKVARKYDGKLWDPICHASLITTNVEGKKIALFSNPYIPGRYMPRTNLTVQVSYDYKTWVPAIYVTCPYEMTQGYTSLDSNNGVLTLVYCDYLSKRIMFVDLSSCNELILDAYESSIHDRKKKN